MNILFHHRTRDKGAEGVHIRGVSKGLRDLGHTASMLSLLGAEPEEAHNNATSTKVKAEQKPKKTGLIASLANPTK